MMQNPEALSGLMGNLGGGGGGGGGMPDMAGMANAFRNSPELMAARSDPDLQDFFRDVDQEGPSAAMRHMSNPKVSQLIQNAMGGIQG
jgi:small glutamine-rich tetratricopeptide repeat-containing protein alpha